MRGRSEEHSSDARSSSARARFGADWLSVSVLVHGPGSGPEGGTDLVNVMSAVIVM